MRILHTEIRRALISKKFLYSIIIGLLTQIISSLLMSKNVIFQYIDGHVGIDALNNILSKYSLWYFSTNTYVFIIPIIACLPYTISLLTDENSNYVNFIKSRTSYRSYIISKIASCFISGFLTVFISSAIFLLIISLTPYVDPNSSISVVGFMSILFENHKNLYLFIYICICYKKSLKSMAKLQQFCSD